MGKAPLACVIGDMDLVRPLGLAGIRCAVVARHGDAPWRSRYTRATIPWLDPASRPGELVRVLLEFAAEQQEPPVLYYQDDPAMSAISRRRNALLGRSASPMPTLELVEALAQAGSQALAERLGLPTPHAGHRLHGRATGRGEALSTCRIPSSSSRRGTSPGGRRSAGPRPSKPAIRRRCAG